VEHTELQSGKKKEKEKQNENEVITPWNLPNPRREKVNRRLTQTVESVSSVEKKTNKKRLPEAAFSI
jgi:hypothetical protein